MKKILFILLLLISITLSAQNRNYYVSMTDGDDDDSGLTPALAWKTIAKLRNVTFQADDSIFFNRGDTWKETFEPYGNGTKNNKIVITAYGTGAKPIITGRDTLSGWSGALNWTQVGATNVWYISVSALESKFRIWINGTEIRKAKHVSWIDATDTFADSAEIDRLYLYSVGNPATVYAGGTIESGWVRSYALYINTRNHYKIENLDLRGGYYSIRLRAADDIIIDSCNIGNSSTSFGLLGERIASPVNQSDSCTVSNCLFDPDSELTSDWEVKYTENGLEVYGGNDWNIHDNYFKNWGHAGIYILTLSTATNHRINIYDNFFTAPDISYGRGFNADCIGSNCADLKFYRNIIRNTPTCNQINNYGTQFYYNIIDTVRGVTFSPGYGQGISITGYATSTLPQHMKFYNNVIANCEDQGIYISHYTGREHKKNNEFINNIIYNSGGESIKIYNNATDTGIYDNVFRNNILYNSGSSDIVYYRGDTITVDEFNDENGTEGDEILENIGEDPEFDGTTFELLATSPAINTGVNVGLITDYVLTGVPQGTYVDIGAYEFVNFPIAVTGLGWEDILSHRNFKGDVNIAGSFMVNGVPIIFSGGSPVNLPGLTASVPELNYTDGVTSGIQGQLNSKADTSLSNLASVAINTNLLPAAAGTIDLGSATYPFDDIALDTASVINFHNGDVTITHSDGAITIDGGNLALGLNDITITGSITTPSAITTSGLVTAASLNVGNTSLSIDSIKLVNGKYAIFVGVDTVGPHILASDIENLNDLAIMQTDTTGGSSNNDFAVTPTYLTTQLANIPSVEVYKVAFKVDSTLYAPKTGDSIYKDSRLTYKHIEVWRSPNDTALLGRVYEESLINGDNYEYEYTAATGQITFHPVFTTGEKVIIEASDTAKWTAYSPRAIDLLNDEYLAIYNKMAYKPLGDTILAQNDLVYSLDTAGYWDRIKLLYIGAVKDSSDAKLNWRDPDGSYNLINTYDPITHVAYQGWDFDGTADHFDTGWNGRTDSVTVAGKVGINTATIAVWSLSAFNADTRAMGVIDAIGNRLSLTIRASGFQSSLINALSGQNLTNATSVGFQMATRRAHNETEGYNDGASLGTDVDESSVIPNAVMHIGCINNNGTFQYFHDGIISIVLVMDGVSDAEAAELYTIFDTYMTAIGQ